METETKWFIAIALTILAIIITISIFFLTKDNNLEYPQQSNLQDCQTLKYVGPEAIDVAFISSKELAEKYSNFFFETSPYDEKQDKFNIHYMDNYDPPCEIYKNVATFCYSKEAVKQTASCPNDIIIVLVDEERHLRSSAYINFITINTKHQLSVLTHELGHVVANLAEEYITGKSPPPDSMNCPGKCTGFDGMEDGCFSGCSKQNLIRSIDAGVMRTLNSNLYGRFNERLITDEILGVRKIKLSGEDPQFGQPSISGQVVQEGLSCDQNEFYLIEIDTQTGEVSNTERHKGCAGTAIGAGADKYKVFSKSDKINAEKEFNFKIYTVAQSENAETIDSGEHFIPRYATLTIPAKSDDHRVEILKQNTLLTEIYLNKIGRTPCKTK